MQRITVLQPARSTAPTAAYPDGSAKNETAAGANDGTPFELARSNDIFGMQQAMVHQLGLVPSGSAETALLSQFLEGVLRLGSLGDFYVESGAANVYVATQFGSIQPRLTYFDGMEIQFKAGNTNTGASTVNVDGLGVTAITRSDGTVLTGGEILANEYSRAKYNLASTRFELLIRDVPLRQDFLSTAQTIASAGLLTLPHGLGVEPKLVQYLIECTSAEGGYSVGDRILVTYNSSDGANARLSQPVIDVTNITIRFTATVNVFMVPNKGTGVQTVLTNANWDLYVRAFA